MPLTSSFLLCKTRISCWVGCQGTPLRLPHHLSSIQPTVIRTSVSVTARLCFCFGLNGISCAPACAKPGRWTVRCWCAWSESGNDERGFIGMQRGKRMQALGFVSAVVRPLLLLIIVACLSHAGWFASPAQAQQREMELSLREATAFALQGKPQHTNCRLGASHPGGRK